jgi:hypothetical protein
LKGVYRRTHLGNCHLVILRDMPTAEGASWAASMMEVDSQQVTYQPILFT